MKRLLSIMVVTIVFGLIAYAFIWVKNEEVGQAVSEITPRKSLINLTSHVKTGAVATGATAESGATIGATGTVSSGQTATVTSGTTTAKKTAETHSGTATAAKGVAETGAKK